MKKKFLLLSILLVGVGLIVASCVKDEKDHKGDQAETGESTELAIQSAREFFENTASDLTLPGEGIIGADGAVTKSATDGPMLIPQWDKAFRHPDEAGDVLEVPLQYGSSLKASVMRTRPGQEPNHKMEEVHSRLIFTRNPYTDSALYLVVTFIAERRFSAAQSHHISQVSAFGNGGKFSGLIVYSTVEGQLVGGRKFLNGVPTHQIRMRGHESHQHGEECDHGHEHDNACAHDHADGSVCDADHKQGEYLSFAFASIPVMTRAGGYGEGWCDDCEKIHWGLCPIWLDPIDVVPCNGPCNGTTANCECYLYCPECEQLWIDCDGHGAQYIQCSICKTCYWDDLGHNCTPPDPGGDDDDNGGDGDGDGGSSGSPNPGDKDKVCEECKKNPCVCLKIITISTMKATQLLLEPFDVHIMTIPANAIITSATLYMNDTPIETKTGNPRSFRVVPRKPGDVSLQIKVTSGNQGGQLASNSRTITSQFPDYDQIVSHYSSVMDALWAKTENACNELTCREYGAVFFIDTRETASKAYDYVEIEGSEYSSDLRGGASINFSFQDENEGIRGGKYSIGIFHTHPPRTYAPSTKNCQVGPSGGDTTPLNPGEPAIVKDYIAIPGVFDDDGNPAVQGGYNNSSRTKLYNYGGNRRTN